jgi:ATP-binding protein involved in chromosome partitioning
MDKTNVQEETGASCSSRNCAGKDDGEALREQRQLKENIVNIDRKILVMSGKGGVGKSSIATNIAVGLSLQGKQVGLMDIDIHGPSIPKMVGLEGAPLQQSETGLMPIEYSANLKVMSIGFLLRDQKDAVIWRAPLKHSLIKQFLTDVNWGTLDYLIVDCPPGTGDELISITQLLVNADGAIVVTTPQDVALTDVRKSITFCHQVKLPVLGVVENMSGFLCPHCEGSVDIFKSGGGEAMAAEMGVPFLGRIPIDPKMVEYGDSGKSLLQHASACRTATAFGSVISMIMGECMQSSSSA